MGPSPKFHSSRDTLLFGRLFDHVDQHHGRLSWGKGVTPGVSAWYPVEGNLLYVWAASTGSGGAGSHPTLFFYFRGLHKKVPGHVERLADLLGQIAIYRPLVEQARSASFEGKGSYPGLHLDVLVKSDTDVSALFKAIQSVTD